MEDKAVVDSERQSSLRWLAATLLLGLFKSGHQSDHVSHVPVQNLLGLGESLSVGC